MKREVGSVGLVVLSGGLALLDQTIKGFIRAIPEGVVLFRVPPLFEITRCTNTGAAFSILSGHPVLLAVLSVLLLSCLLAYVLRSLRLTAAGKACVALMLGGGAGNLIDRIAFGGVSDYIRLLFMDFPVFNFADMLITISVFGLILLLFSGKLETTEASCGEDCHGSDH